MEIKTVTEKEIWDGFLKNQEHSRFLQAWAFGEFNEKLGNKIWRFGSFQGKDLVGVCLVVKLSSKFVTFFYLPFGPVGKWEMENLLRKFGDLAKKEKAAFVRLDPREKIELPKEGFTFRTAPGFTQPQTTALLSLEKDIEEIKKNFSESTRYNVSWVERQGVKIISSTSESDFEKFLELLKETSTRQGFRLFQDLNYYRQQFKAFALAGSAKVFLALSPGSEEVLAAAVVIYFGDSVTYLHAASSSKNPKLRAPYLMQWKIIQSAKDSGYKWYDFWGVAKTDSKKDPWWGVTNFKLSFGGERYFYNLPVDLIVSRYYYLSVLFEKLRSLKKII